MQYGQRPRDLLRLPPAPLGSFALQPRPALLNARAEIGLDGANLRPARATRKLGQILVDRRMLVSSIRKHGDEIPARTL